MNINYLLDINIISELLRPNPNQSIVKNFQKHSLEIGTAAVVWHELIYGCYRLPKSEKRTAIESFIFEVIAPSIPILPYDKDAAFWHASERSRLSALGKTPPFVDGQIAAIAGINNLTLVTSNTRDFENFKNIQIENWKQ
jgi:tRNA(fMet)-specific endonuclease VapC